MVCVRSEGGGTGRGDNLRPEEAPDFAVLSVSGHNFGMGDCDWRDPEGRQINCEYLLGRGTINALAAPITARGYTASAFAFGDSFYSWDVGDEPIVNGFLNMLEVMEAVRTLWIADYDNPTRVIMVAHSHGTVWAHIALFLNPRLPIDILIDLDGESLSWESDNWNLEFAGDEWSEVIRAYTEEHGVDWGFEIWHASNAYEVPGLLLPQDIEDITPDNVALNLEVAANGLVIQDGEPNHRPDGSDDGIVRVFFDESHGAVTYPDSGALTWVAEAIELAYFE